jgi:hypothetical protein
MVSEYIRLLKERVNLRILLLALSVTIAGLAVLYVSAQKALWKDYETWQTLLQNVGSTLFVAGAITLLWELVGKRAFLDEVLAKAGVSKEVSFAGILRITDSFHQDVDWKSYFQSVQKLDIFFAYGRTWRNAHIHELRTLLGREGARARVVLPDPEDKQTMEELARRFSYTPDQLVELIREAERDFKGLRGQAGTRGAELSIWFLPAAPHFTFYRFDRIAVLALYTHRRERAPVPTFVCEMGGTLYDYIRKEFDAMIAEKGLARLVAKVE